MVDKIIDLSQKMDIQLHKPQSNSDNDMLVLDDEENELPSRQYDNRADGKKQGCCK